MAALAQRREQLATPQLAVPVRFVDLEVGGGGVVEDQVDVEAQQVGAAQEHVALDLVAPDGEEVERTIELVDGQFVRLWQPSDVGQPARCTAQFRAWIVEALCRHGEQRHLVRRAQVSLCQARADGRADAEFLPQGAGGQHNAEFEDGIDRDVGQAGLAAGGQGVDGIGVDDALDGGDEALQGGFVELIGAAEVVDDLRLGALGLGVPDILGEGVVGDGGAIAVTPLGDAQIHAYEAGMKPLRIRSTFSCAYV